MKQVGKYGLWVPEDTDAPDAPSQLTQLIEGAGGVGALDDVLAAAGGNFGSSVISTEQSRTNAAYGLLGTADEVPNVVVEKDGLLFVSFMAIWKSSVKAAGRAALFIGSNQLKIPRISTGTFQTQAAATFSATAGNWEAVTSGPFGLISSDGAGSFGAMPTTGVAVTAGFGTVTEGEGGTRLTYEVNGEYTVAPSNSYMPPGGLIVIEGLAEGEYDVSVQWKSASGSITAKERRLRAWSRNP